MLQLNSICKSYTTGNFTQQALDNVSIAFRDNEFVAILGPSGSGKTTMLNIVGGLDHYDSGDLVIDGISTKQFKDRDWDTYRNNRIGFVFQSYNLIPHQTVLANVELALTLSGVSPEERHERAVKALERVGLADHVDKKPAQMSGGQMQRVAIARALINDPEILLADEPTGALDSKTSVQIMDLLTEIADDRLVVMVTHNPELAEQYATRIVNLADGHITSDSDPYEPNAEEIAEAHAKPTRQTRMSFLTALSLSFNNLMTKKGRTIMTAIAGSIGIIGIAAILSLANGVNNYIKSVEEETLSAYPLQIMSSGFDMSAMFVGMGGSDSDDEQNSTASSQSGQSQIGEVPVMSRMFASFGKNDLASLKEYLDKGNSGIENYTSSIKYKYSVTPQIFDADTSEKVRQINPDSSFNSMGLGSSSSTNSLMSMSMSTNMFSEMMDSSVVSSQYDVVVGHWPEGKNELVLVLSRSGKINDFLSYVLGLRDSAKLNEMVKKFSNDETVDTTTDPINISYDDILGMKFKLVNASDFYSRDDEHDAWIDKSGDEEYLKSLVDNGEDLVITGIVQPKPETKTSPLSMGVYYTSDLTRYLVDQASQSQIVKDQIADSKRDVFSGKSFDELQEDSDTKFDMSSLFSIDESVMMSAFSFDTSSLDLSGIDASSMPAFDPSSMDMSKIALPDTKPESIPGLAEIEAEATASQKTAIDALASDMYKWVQANPTTNGFNPAGFFTTPQGQADMMNVMAQGLSQDNITQISKVIATYAASQIQLAFKQQIELAVYAYMNKCMEAITAQMGTMMSGISSSIGFNSAAFANAFQFNMSAEDLTELMMSMMNVDERSYDNNLKKLGYADFNKPSEIDIYPKDFESKEHVIQILDSYNEQMRATDEDKVVSYTDLVGALMESVTTIINMISYVLIAFVAISLIVSSIMIGVITYISVLERKKEIGVLRSIGASKGDISRVFNAETIIEGLIAGLLGVGVTALGCIPANIIVYTLFDVPNVAILPIGAAVILVAISVFLTFIAGLIPSRSASRKDPVEALRSE